MFHKLKHPLFKGEVEPRGNITVMKYKAEFTILARYVKDEKCYRFLRGLKDELRYALIPLRI
ncbi:hypothetical protein IEQ34_014350 [Dendrobium chrysotoxum]|uniref:Retrotransposon gag domain-containing protein n=1 Tax=Dendrobium chrysotoxum TaxID=161865 RepID=A0AAV7GLF3_DENCH|nr:hypothetical protein IEQ34_014350 [Dendrobium chrysotoxum]